MAGVRLSRALGEIFVTVGLLLLLFGFYESYWTNLVSHRLQQQVNAQLDEAWRNPRAAGGVHPGEGFARLQIPRFGADFQFAILEGIDETELVAGPGHYPDTQLPGQRGNFAVAGHRVGKGAPFNDLGSLQACDEIVVETPSAQQIYKVLPMDVGGARETELGCFGQEQRSALRTTYAGLVGRQITVPSDVAVIDPVPGTTLAADAAPEGLITLTTCHPRFSNAERMIIHGMLVETRAKDGAEGVAGAAGSGTASAAGAAASAS